MINQEPTLVQTKREKFCQELRQSRRQKTISNQRTLSIVSGYNVQQVETPRVQPRLPNSLFEDTPLVNIQNPLPLDINMFFRLEPKLIAQALPHVPQPPKLLEQPYKFEPIAIHREKPVLPTPLIKPLRQIDLTKNRCPDYRFCDSKNRVRLRKNNYTVFQKQLGRGAFSTVYLGVDETLNREVAVKEMTDVVDAQVEVMRQVSSQHIIKMYDFWRKGSKYYIVLELCQGSLKQKRSSLNYQQSCEIFRQILEGMKVLHFNNIIHRDIKLENILIKDEKVKISDFGLAKNLGSKQKVQSMKCGTPCMMAPQVFFFPNKNSKPVYDSKCDVWSLGIVLYELIYRYHPFGYDFERVRQCDRIKPNKPIPEIQTILNHCLKLDPADRPEVPQLLRMWNDVMEVNTPKKTAVTQGTQATKTKNKNVFKKKKMVAVTPTLEAFPVRLPVVKRPEIKKVEVEPIPVIQPELKNPFQEKEKPPNKQPDRPYVIESHSPPEVKRSLYHFKQSIFMAFLFVSVIAIKCFTN